MRGRTKRVDRRNAQPWRRIDKDDIEVPRQSGVGKLSREGKARIFLTLAKDECGKQLVFDVRQFQRCAH